MVKLPAMSRHADMLGIDQLLKKGYALCNAALARLPPHLEILGTLENMMMCRLLQQMILSQLLNFLCLLPKNRYEQVPSCVPLRRPLDEAELLRALAEFEAPRIVANGLMDDKVE
jgi:hypothetical protein